jgi:hypothetical protein
MFLLLVFCSIEILHAWSVVKAVEWSALADIMGVGAYVSIAILALIGVFLGLRLRFIQSVKGEFYEQQLAASANAITRWRDTIDNMIIDSFMNRRLLIGRMFVNPRNKPANKDLDLH